ncbi:MAG: hypothetical protein KDE51_22955, partial [Anaerolineales bacterium]|nr:hypothetical protein [Anaerolineales bacterium]
MMVWQEYRKRYSVFLSALQQTEMIIFLAGNAIADEDIKVQESDQYELPFLFNNFRKIMQEVSGGYKSDDQFLNVKGLVDLVFQKQKERILCSQELVMIMAHFEAFVADTLSTIWHLDPKLLEGLKPGKEVLSKSKFSSLASLSQEELSILIEKSVYFKTQKTINAPLDYLTNELGLGIEINSTELLVAHLNRNAIVHNGGIITQKMYIDRLNPKEQKGLKPDTLIAIDIHYITKIYNLILFLGEQIFSEVSKTYFNEMKPLQENELVTKRQPPDLPINPA